MIVNENKTRLIKKKYLKFYYYYFIIIRVPKLQLEEISSFIQNPETFKIRHSRRALLIVCLFRDSFRGLAGFCNGIHVTCTDYATRVRLRRVSRISDVSPSIRQTGHRTHTHVLRARVGSHVYLPRNAASPGIEIFTDVQRPLTLGLAKHIPGP